MPLRGMEQLTQAMPLSCFGISHPAKDRLLHTAQRLPSSPADHLGKIGALASIKEHCTELPSCCPHCTSNSSSGQNPQILIAFGLSLRSSRSCSTAPAAQAQLSHSFITLWHAHMSFCFFYLFSWTLSSLDFPEHR